MDRSQKLVTFFIHYSQTAEPYHELPCQTAPRPTAPDRT